MTLHTFLEEERKEFDKRFPALKSAGHKKIHRDSHSAHDGSRCDGNCKYVAEAIKDFIQSHDQRLLEKIREMVEKNSVVLEHHGYIDLDNSPTIKTEKVIEFLTPTE